MVLILKSIPMVVMKLVVKESSENRNNKQLLPTPIEPINIDINRQRRSIAGVRDERKRGRMEEKRSSRGETGQGKGEVEARLGGCVLDLNLQLITIWLRSHMMHFVLQPWPDGRGENPTPTHHHQHTTFQSIHSGTNKTNNHSTTGDVGRINDKMLSYRECELKDCSPLAFRWNDCLPTNMKWREGNDVKMMPSNPKQCCQSFDYNQSNTSSFHNNMPIVYPTMLRCTYTWIIPLPHSP